MDMSGLSCYGCGLTDAKSICTITSPFTHLVFDYTPKSIETARGFISKSESRLTTLDAAIERLQHHRDQLHHATLRHRNYLSPISRLSDDILLLVFQEAIEYRTITRPKVDIWDLSAVCSRWRSLALSSRTLWVRLIVDLSGPSEDETTDERSILLCCRRALLQLERAVDQPLICYISLPTNGDAYQHPFIPSSIRQVVSKLHQCSALTMNGSGPSSWKIFPPTQPTFSVLRTLEYMNTGEGFDSKLFTRMPRFFEVAPLLDHLDICEVRLSQPFPESWMSLTVLSLSKCHVRLEEFIDLLSFTENLKTLYLRLIMTPGIYGAYASSIFSDDLPDDSALHDPGDPEHPEDLTPDPPSSTRTVPLLHLTELNIDFEWPYGLHRLFYRHKVIKAVLPCIRCPNLATLRLSGPTLRDGDIQIVQGMILASENPSSVQSVSFINLEDEDTSESVISLLAKLPCLQSLTIAATMERRIDYDPILQALRWPAQEEANRDSADLGDHIVEGEQLQLCSDLRHLELGYLRLNSRLFHEMVVSRSANPSVQRLQSITADQLLFTDDVPPSGDHLEWLKEGLRDSLRLKAVEIYYDNEADSES